MASPGTQIPKTKRILFSFLTVLAVLVIVEVGAALLLGMSQGNWPSLGQTATRRDAVLGGEADLSDPVAAAADRLQTPHVLHPYLGFTRDPEAGAARSWKAPEEELFFEPSSDRVVIAVLGGSVADIAAVGGSGLAMELRKVDRFSNREIAVISLAQGGFKQPQQLTLLGYLLAMGAHFDVVINLDGFNEVALPSHELMPRGVFPFYPRGWDQRLAPLDSEVQRGAAIARRDRQRRRDLARRFSTWPRRAGYTLALTWHALDRQLARSIAASEQSLLQTQSDVTYGTHGPRRNYDSSAEMHEDLARFWYRSSLQIHHLCRGQGIEYHHFLQPNQYLEGAKPVTAEQAAGTWLPDHPYRPAVEQAYPRLIDLGQELKHQGVAFTDLTAIFAGRDELLYSDSCCHLNFLGNTLLQRAIAHRLGDGGFERPENVSDGGLALEGYDPVSYFDRQPVRGAPEISATHDGIRYRFANPANRKRFLADPKGFLPRYGGWCAFGLGMDEGEMKLARERYPVDPESYEIFAGELYVFYRSATYDAREHWRLDPERFRKQADETWQRLRRQRPR